MWTEDIICKKKKLYMLNGSWYIWNLLLFVLTHLTSIAEVPADMISEVGHGNCSFLDHTDYRQIRNIVTIQHTRIIFAYSGILISALIYF